MADRELDRRINRARGGLIGLLVGDALGVPFEFRASSEIIGKCGGKGWARRLTFETPRTWRRSHAGTPPGTWSDDGAQALALGACVQGGGRDLHEVRLGLDLVAWYQVGAWTPDGHVFDVGIQTSRAIGHLARDLGEPLPRDEEAAGNGAAMRVLPLGLAWRGDAAGLVRAAIRSAALTHPSRVAELSAALVALWGWELATGQRRREARALPPWERLAGVLELGDGPAWRPALARLRSGQVNGSGYAPDTIATVAAALDAAFSYGIKRSPVATWRRAVREAILIGGDTDTTAAIAGGLAGAALGERAIPVKLRRELRGLELFEGVAAHLAAELRDGAP